MPDLRTLLRGMPAARASDLHVKAGVAPRYRVDGQLEEVEGARAWPARDLYGVLVRLLDDEQERRLHEERVLHFAFTDDDGLRFRASCYHDHFGPAATFRLIPAAIPTLRDLGLPRGVAGFAHRSNGLVLVTGGMGAGRSTTLASLVDTVNREYRRFILTLEDPIEHRFTPKKSMVMQRGLSYDIHDFAAGIRDAVRQKADVLMVGELRDAATIREALKAAETGMLVFSSLPTLGAVESLEFLVGAFPTREHALVRAMLAQALAGIVSQVLLPRVDGEGRVPAAEVLMGTATVANLIREGKPGEVLGAIQAGRGQGMVCLDDSLEELLQKERVRAERAFAHARNKGRFTPWLDRARRTKQALAEDDWVNQFAGIAPGDPVIDLTERRNLRDRE